MKLRNLTPFLMLDHFHVSKGAVSNINILNARTVNHSSRGFPITRTVAKPPSPTCLKGECRTSSCLFGPLTAYSSSQHEDSAGHKGTILTGGVQWMTAVSIDCLDRISCTC